MQGSDSHLVGYFLLNPGRTGLADRRIGGSIAEEGTFSFSSLLLKMLELDRAGGRIRFFSNCFLIVLILYFRDSESGLLGILLRLTLFLRFEVSFTRF